MKSFTTVAFCPIVAALTRGNTKDLPGKLGNEYEKRTADIEGKTKQTQDTTHFVSQLLAAFNKELEVQTALGDKAMQQYKEVACQCTNVQDEAQSQLKEHTAELNTQQTEQETATNNVNNAIQRINTATDNIRIRNGEIADEKKRHKGEVTMLTAVLQKRNNGARRCREAVHTIKEHTGLNSDHEAFLQEYAADVNKEFYEHGSEHTSSSNGAIEAVTAVCETLDEARTQDEKNIKDETADHGVKDSMLNADLKQRHTNLNNAEEDKSTANAALAKAMNLLGVAYRGKMMAMKTLDDSFNKCELDKVNYDTALGERTNSLQMLHQVQTFIANDEAFAYATDKATTGFIDLSPSAQQRNNNMAFMQLREASSSPVESTIESLREAAHRLHSSKLSTLATNMAKNKHFDQITGMIRDMIQKMETSVKNQISQEGFCKGEEAKIQLKIDQQTSAFQSASANVQASAADMSDTKKVLIQTRKTILEKVTIHNKEVSLRNSESAFNNANIAQTIQGIGAMQKALVVIKAAYNKKGQQSVTEAGVGGGQQAGALAIFGMMELAISKYTDSRDRSARTEAEQSKAWTQLKADLVKDMSVLKMDNSKLMSKLTDAKSDNSDAFNEYDMAYENLQSASADQASIAHGCDHKGKFEQHEDRAAAREAELAALKEAYQILDNKRF